MTFTCKPDRLWKDNGSVNQNRIPGTTPESDAMRGHNPPHSRMKAAPAARVMPPPNPNRLKANYGLVRPHDAFSGCRLQLCFGENGKIAMRQ
jgi:hypothetical protein